MMGAKKTKKKKPAPKKDILSSPMANKNTRRLMRKLEGKGKKK